MLLNNKIINGEIMTIISVANQKGGVGKTTITLNLAHALCEKGYDVLVIDLDPQFNLSFGILGMDLLNYADKNIGILLSKNSVKKDEVMESTVKVNAKLDLIPSHLQLSAVEKILVNAYAREMKLKNIIDAVKYNYDYILIDNAPSLGLFLINSLVASDYILIPCEPSYFSIAGVQLMLDTVEEINESNLNPNLKVMGFIFNKYTKQSKIPQERLEQLQELYDNIPVMGIIPRAVAVEKAEHDGKSIFEYDENNPASAAFKELAEKVIKNVRK